MSGRPKLITFSPSTWPARVYESTSSDTTWSENVAKREHDSRQRGSQQWHNRYTHDRQVKCRRSSPSWR